jgi:hypothetical protein
MAVNAYICIPEMLFTISHITFQFNPTEHSRLQSCDWQTSIGSRMSIFLFEAYYKNAYKEGN